MAWVCNKVRCFFPKKSLCAPFPHPFGGGPFSRSPCSCRGRFSASRASAVHLRLEQFWVSLMARIPDLFIRKI